MATSKMPYDPEMLYVECGICGQPVLWETGKSTEVLENSGLAKHDVDAACMIVSDGCPFCTPEEEYFVTHIVRLEVGEGSYY